MGLRCLIVDDSTPFLQAARALLEREGITVVAVASTGTEARRLINEADPDVVLVDIDLGDENGFDLVEQLARDGRDRAGGASPVVILVSSHSREDFEELVMESAAAGFVSKSSMSAAAIMSMMGEVV